MSFSWQVPPTRAFPALADAYTAAIRRGVRAIADRYAPEIEAYMKDNATWTDQTGNARANLRAEVEEIAGEMAQIVLSHGVEYGTFLELAHGGAYAILAPTVDVFGPRIWADVRAMLR